MTNKKTTKQYCERDVMALDRAGGYYARHIQAMTTEGLESKSDIAAELGWRDMRIAKLDRSNSKVRVKHPTPQPMDAQISIVRPGTSDDTEIRLIIRIAMGKTITAVMTPEDFALAVTGKSDVPASLRLRNLHIEDNCND